MSGWIKLEKRLITQYKDGCIFKTKVIGYEWFPLNNHPQEYVIQPGNIQWCVTSEMKFQKDKPI